MGTRGRSATARARVAKRPSRTLPPGDAAWLAAVPLALLTALAIAMLGVPLGRALFTPAPARFVASGVAPEPAEHARFLIAALAPFALAAIVVRASGRPLAGDAWTPRLVPVAQALLLAFLTVAVVAQRTQIYRVAGQGSERRVYFTLAALLVAAVVAAALAAALQRPQLLERLRAATRDTRRRRLAAAVVAVALLAAWMLTAFNTEGSIGRADLAVRDNVPFWLDETFAVLNGSAPLATFHAQYAQLWPYVTAGAMALLGTTFGVYAGVMIAATSAAMLAVFATLRRVAGSALLALALFVPFLSTSFFKEQGTFADRYGPANLFSLFPIRYGGPYLLAWLVARRLGRERPQSATLLCFVAGLVLLNNPEFGAPAFAATLAALVWTLPQPRWRELARIAAAAAAGALGALLVVVLVTLLAAGELPRLGLLFEFSRIYGLDGFGMLPMPTLGLHLALYATFAAALVLATVRAVARERDVLLTGLLCWIGVFGLGAGGYFAGRSHPEVLIDLFSPWALALALLLIATIRAVEARPSRRPTLAELAVLLGFGLTVCSIAQTPTPWSQLARLRETTAQPRYRPLALERFVRAHTTPGEHVMLLTELGHRVAYDVGVVDRFPYANLGSAPAVAQWETVLAIAREDPRIRSIFVVAEVRHTPLSARGFNETIVGGFRAAGFVNVVAQLPSANVLQITR